MTTPYWVERVGEPMNRHYRVPMKTTGESVSVQYSDGRWRVFHPRLPPAGIEHLSFKAARACAVATAKELDGEPVEGRAPAIDPKTFH